MRETNVTTYSNSVQSDALSRILIVDDNPAIHEDFEKVLGQRETDDQLLDAENELFGSGDSKPVEVEYIIDHAYQGADAFEMIMQAERNELPYDLAIVDMRMPPGWDGLETVEKLWTVDPELQIVICTAFSDYSWRDIVERLDNNDNFLILKKPFDNIEVSQMASALTKKRSLMREREQYTSLLESRVLEQTLSTRRAHEETIFRLVNASMYRDCETGAHIQRVGQYSAALAKLLGWCPTEVERIRMAAPMHDVGKIGIPDHVLLKPGKFTPEDREIMERHTLIGFKLLDGSDSKMLQMAAEIALHHHENWDGNGYPYGKSYNEIPLPARIVSVVDVFDALSQDRVYRPAMPPHEVIKNMTEESGRKFEPELAKLFLDNYETFQLIAEENSDASSM